MNNNYQRKMSYDIINDEYISDEDYKYAINLEWIKS